MRRPTSIFFERDQGMTFFLGFLVLMTIFVPMVTLSRPARVGVGIVFALTFVSGAIATIRHRALMLVIIALSFSAVTTHLAAEFFPALVNLEWEAAVKLASMSILVIMTVKQTFRPGPVTGHRVMGGIAGYLLIGITWTLAYQVVVLAVPDAIHFASPLADIPLRQPNHLIYFSFATLTTIGYGDAYPVHQVARSLAIAEALVGQLYLAILIAALVSMALQSRSSIAAPEKAQAA